MPSDLRAILFCPPLAPLELERDKRVAIGRGRDCELPLFSDSASRRHAEVYAEGEEFLVRDLGSKNGTFVNGEAVAAPRALRPGDRIGIGANTITFCRVDASFTGFLSDPAGHETMVIARAIAREVFRGDLAEMPAFVVLQMLEMGHKSGVLEISADDGLVRIWLGDGQPLDAESEKARGVDAALAVVGLSSGAFRFVANVDAPARTIDIAMTELLLEGSRLFDEGTR
ncbi:MAG TPA: FHA domain-containing protein [Myxococcota bacterium]|nr:FHA domain-containing protein [Myxococcota bacterium]